MLNLNTEAQRHRGTEIELDQVRKSLSGV